MSDLKTTIPGPRGNFLMGSLPDIQRDRVKFLVDLQRDFGDVAKIRLGPFQAVVVFHPDGVQHVLQDNHANYSHETRTYDNFGALVGNGLIRSTGTFFLRQRRLMQPAFHRQQVNNFGEMMCQEARLTMDHWAADYGDGRFFNIAGELMAMNLSIVTRALFGSRLTDPNGKIADAIGFMLEDPAFRFENPFYPPLSFPTPYNRRFIASRKFLDQLIYGMIAERRRNPDASHDLLSMLLQAEEEGSGMSDQQVRDEVVTIILAGHETTAMALTWTLYLLSQTPEVEIRLRREVSQVLGSRTPVLADLPALTYTRRVLDESLRLYPPAWIVERKALGDDEVCGYRIPAGATLACTSYATHRNPKYWENPEQFDPDRFSPERAKDRPRYAYFPYGGGPHLCMGNNFAQVELHLLLPMFLQRFCYELDPSRKVHTDPEVALRPKGGMWMRVMPAS